MTAVILPTNANNKQLEWAVTGYNSIEITSNYRSKWSINC